MASSTRKPPKKRAKHTSKVVELTPKIDPENPIEAEQPAEIPEEPEPPAEKPAAASGPNREVFPTPPRGTGKGSFCTDQAGMDYWRAIPKRFYPRLVVYVNREWPILDRIQELDAEAQSLVRQNKKRPPFKYIDKITEPFGADTRMEFLHRYGSGVYKIYVNDVGVKKAKTEKGEAPALDPRTLCKFVVRYVDSDFPPILDPSRPDQGIGILDWSHPENKSYIGELRLKGILPPGIKPGDDDMMNSEVIDKLANKVESLATEVAAGKQDAMYVKLSTEIADLKKQPQGDALQGALIQFLLKDREKPAADTTGGPVVVMLQNQLTALQVELREERAERRKYEDSIRERANREPTDPFTFLERTVTTIEKARTLLQGNGTNGVPGSIKQSRMSGTLEFFREIVPEIINAPILNALSQRILGAPVSTLTNGASTAAAPATSTAGSTVTAAPMSQDELLRFVQFVVTPAMLNYLQDGASGIDFASWIFAGFPQKLQQLQQLGPAAIISTYKESPTWRVIAPREAQFHTFVNEFCAWRATDDTAPAGADTNGTGAPGEPVTIDLDAQLNEPLEGASL